MKTKKELTKLLSHDESKELLDTLTHADNACPMVKKIKRLLDEGYIFYPGYAGKILDQVSVCGCFTKSPEFNSLCWEVIEKLKRQV